MKKQKNWKIHFTVSIMDSSHFMDSLIHCIIWIMTCLKTVSCMIMKTERKTRFHDMEKQCSLIAEIFLGGSKSLISIENPNAKTDRELVMFRDSFGSSIAPLLAEDYAKITLVDIRYLPVERIGNYIDFKDQNVLFYI